MTQPPGVVILGAGHAGVQVAASLEELGYGRPVTLVDAQACEPYQRPPLSKDLLTDPSSRRDLRLRPRDFFNSAGRQLLQAAAQRIDAPGKRVLLSDGSSLPYEHLVLAVGARPRPLPNDGMALPNVQHLSTLAEAQRLSTALPSTRRLVVVGGGFIGLEVAAAARKRGVHVTVVEAATRLLARTATAETAAHVLEHHRRSGVEVLLGAAVATLQGNEAGVTCVHLSDGTRLACDLVVVSIGVRPDTALAEEAGLLVNDGVLTDEDFRTSDRSIFAVGDCARRLGKDGTGRRLESLPNANEQARAVAAVLSDVEPQAPTAPWFWTTQGGLRLQIAGLPGQGDAVIVPDRPAGQHSAYSFAAGRLVAVESVCQPAEHTAARRLLTAGRPVTLEVVQAADFDLLRLTRAGAA